MSDFGALSAGDTVVGRMPTRKQQKRRRKRFVHGAPERAPLPAGSERAEKAPPRAAKRPDRRSRTVSTRAGRKIPEPSLKRSARKAAGLFVLMTVAFWLIDARRHTVSVYALQSLVPALLFVPLSYYFDRFFHNRLTARQSASR